MFSPSDTLYITLLTCTVSFQEVDFAAAGFSVTAEREMAIDFAAPYFNEESVVITKRPQEESRVLLFLRPFSYVQLAGDVTCIILT